METKDLLLNGKDQDALVDDAHAKGVRGRLVVMQWPPLRDSEARERLHALTADGPTTFAARIFPDARVTTKAYDEYVERYFRFVDNAVEYDAEQTIHGLSSTSRTCKTCSSHVAVEYVRGESCPVCGSDLRSNTIQKTLARWEERIAKVREQGDGEAAKAGWLGSWVAVATEGGEAIDPADARLRTLYRKYDSTTTTIANDGATLHLPHETMDRLAARAQERGLSPADYVEELLAND